MHGPDSHGYEAVEARDTSEGNLAAPPRFYASSPFFSGLLAPSDTSSRVKATIPPPKDVGCPSTRLPMMTIRGRESKLPPAARGSTSPQPPGSPDLSQP